MLVNNALRERTVWQLETMTIFQSICKTEDHFYPNPFLHEEGKAPSREKEIKGRDMPADTKIYIAILKLFQSNFF